MTESIGINVKARESRHASNARATVEGIQINSDDGRRQEFPSSGRDGGKRIGVGVRVVRSRAFVNRENAMWRHSYVIRLVSGSHLLFPIAFFGLFVFRASCVLLILSCQGSVLPSFFLRLSVGVCLPPLRRSIGNCGRF